VNFCPVEAAEIEAALAETQVRADAVAALEREIALSDRQCHPTVPVLPATPAPEREGNAAPAPAETDRADVEQRLEERGGERGDLNFTLEWASTDDIDLYVTCPSGQTVSYKNPADCGGVYDLDANVITAKAIGDPVENIVFNDAPTGIYKVRAHLRTERNDGEKTVILHVLRRDGPSQSYEGKVGGGQSDEWVTNISISR